MRFEITGGPGAAAARVKLDQGDTLTAEVGSMIAMTPGLEVSTSTATRSGGAVGQALRRVFAGESLFLNHFIAAREGQEVILAPKCLGDIRVHTLRGGALIIQAGSWLASSHGVQIDATWKGLQNALFSGEGGLWVRASGQGSVLLNAFGAIYAIDVAEDGETAAPEGGHIVDTGHIVAFEEGLTFRTTKAARTWGASLLGGERLVCDFSGRGKLYCQTHDPRVFGRGIGRLLRRRDA